ncbi:MAG: glycoside hydrolase domain-containing protein, partial [Gemmatimonadaceae bacterium]
MSRRRTAATTVGRKWIDGFFRAAVGAAAVASVACSRGDESQRIASITANIAQAAAAVTGQDAQFADEVAGGHYVGFDTHTYPGTTTMRAWKETPGAPYSWVGYYLPSPCHANTSWTGKRDTLQAMGWGLAVVYVGQQTWGRSPRKSSLSALAALRKHTTCSADFLSANEGVANADEAVRRASDEGFQKGAVVFLDLERMEKVKPAMRDYYRAWVARMISTNQYRPGVYMHQHNAQEIFTDVRDVFAAAGDTETPRFWIAGGKHFDEGRAPQDVGFAFAGVWQGVIDVARSVANLRLPVDVNVASWRSPSESG